MNGLMQLQRRFLVCTLTLLVFVSPAWGDIMVVPDKYSFEPVENPVGPSASYAWCEFGVPLSEEPDCDVPVGLPGLFTSGIGATMAPDVFTYEAANRFESNLSLKFNARRAQAITEPSSLMLLMFGVGILAIYRRR